MVRAIGSGSRTSWMPSRPADSSGGRRIGLLDAGPAARVGGAGAGPVFRVAEAGAGGAGAVWAAAGRSCAGDAACAAGGSGATVATEHPASRAAMSSGAARLSGKFITISISPIYA